MLARDLFLSGQIDEARPGLSGSRPSSKRTDGWLKQIEAAAFLGDDAAVVVCFAARATAALDRLPNSSLFYHLAAVVHLRQDDAAEARRLWERALTFDDPHPLARANHDHLTLFVCRVDLAPRHYRSATRGAAGVAARQ